MLRVHDENDDAHEEISEFDEQQTDLVEHTIFNGSEKPVSAPANLDMSTSLDFDFDLDIFQLESIKAVNTDNSVLVVASTSAGKSVIAYHAISKSIENGNVAIYTAPVKSLANQKYVELSSKFDDVGLITGDVSTSPSSSCLVMTAEVLRNQLFSGAPNISKVKHIILDEAHYISDEQRGVVWEQIIISAPENVKFVLLTATLPNYYDLASWVSIVHNSPVHCIYQKRRPVPLHIHAVKETGTTVLIKDGDKPLNSGELSKICAATNEIGSIQQNSTLPRDPQPFEIANHANNIVSQGNFPLLLFCLSRRRCFKIAKHLNGIEDNEALEFFDSASDEWDPHIKKSEQFSKIRELVQRGIGVHHSGILPIIRETIELLFSTGKLVILVATETFALGVNAPARAVMFASLIKWGGSSFRPVSPSEFLQMAGRAGRRGFDEFGNVYIFVMKGYNPTMIASVVGALPNKLVSRMKVTSSLVLACNMMRIDPFEFIKKSLLFYLNNKRLPSLQKKLNRITNNNNKADNANNADNTESTNATHHHDNAIDINDEELCKYATLLKQVVNITLAPAFIRDVLKKGRILYIIHEGVTWGWASVNTFENSFVNVYVPATKDKLHQNIPSNTVKDSFIASIKFPLSSICAVSNIVMKNPETISGASRVAFLLSTFDAVRKKHGNFPILKIDKTKICESARKVLTEFNIIENSLMRKKKRDYVELCSLIEEKISLEEEIRKIENPPTNHYIESYIQLFRNMNYTTKDDLLDLKGRVAIALHVDDPLPIVELLFSGFFTSLTSSEVCIVVSCFVESPPKIKSPKMPALISLWGKIETKLAQLKKTILDLGLPKLEIPKKRVMYFMYQFLEKKSITEAISNINGLTDGIAVRILKRVKELLVQFEEASVLMSVTSLVVTFNTARALLLEGANFESSLYKGDD
ncbi:ATP-dependent RNA helicase DOB1 [Tritrichomonas foetus]|uniref:ATP-dependent RNA helicase DOB1 n=1 Tax=Tritrichomonas foetus TaxID=1144522 RepID=A0A1J4KNM8_9EUKA|nr:ATP-dependent RNA helicase DOB1 [Tritrichomonas foetus]|eukprot:OHT11404.1 ATP-dependent RNA helicase DOB1 [Tritrichomonas foetus]